MSIPPPSTPDPPSIISLNDSSLPSSVPASPSPMIPEHVEASSSATQVESEPIVGGIDTRFGRKQLQLLNTLRDIGLDRDVDLPSIAIIGSQSSGKSSLIHAATGIPLPKAPGDACTKCPIECRLMCRDEPWSCQVYLRLTFTQRGPSSSSKVPFGDVITDKDCLEERVFRAQLAILSPNTPSQEFLDEGVDLSAQPELSFTTDIVCLEATGPEYSDISFVDLPGLIRTVGTSGNRDNIQLIEDLARRYISKQNCIILMTITCETDFANQGAYDLARTYDPDGRRTVGILTKPDRSPEAAHERWVRYISGEIEPLRHGWFCVKLHDTQSPHPQPTLQEARDFEETYFHKSSIWYGLPRQARERLGTKNLVRHLEVILSELISSILVEIHNQIPELEENAANALEKLGKPPSDDSVGEINSLVDQLVRDIEGGIERRSREDGDILRRIEAEAVKFISNLRETCPEFRAWNQDTKDAPSVTPIPELLLEDGAPSVNRDRRNIIFLDDVVSKKTRSSARGLPDGERNEVAEEYLRSFIASWHVPTNQFVKSAHFLLREFIHNKIDARCGNFSNGGLPTHLRDTIEGHLNGCLEKTEAATSLLLKLERCGHTRNERYFRECKDKFLNHLKMQRDLAQNNPILRDLKRLTSPGQGEKQPHAPFVSAINQVKTNLAKANIPLNDELELAKLLPPQSTDSALEDMAKASAGFEVALRRFVDYIPLVVDTELVRGVCQDLTVALRKSFRFSEPNAAERCGEFLREPVETQGEREELREKLRRLSRAEEELRVFWGP